MANTKPLPEDQTLDDEDIQLEPGADEDEASPESADPDTDDAEESDTFETQDDGDGDEDGSSEDEDEPRVKLKEHLALRDRAQTAETRAERAERERDDYSAKLNALLPTIEAFETSLPEFKATGEANAALEAKTRELEEQAAATAADLAYFQDVERLAVESGVDLPDRQQAKLSAIVERLARDQADTRQQLAALPTTLESTLLKVSKANETRYADADRKAREAHVRKQAEAAFAPQWDAALKKAPVLDEPIVRDAVLARFVEDGGTKPVESYVAKVITTHQASTKAESARLAARKKATKGAGGGGGRKPAGAFDFKSPESTIDAYYEALAEGNAPELG